MKKQKIIAIIQTIILLTLLTIILYMWKNGEIIIYNTKIIETCHGLITNETTINTITKI